MVGTFRSTERVGVSVKIRRFRSNFSPIVFLDPANFFFYQLVILFLQPQQLHISLRWNSVAVFSLLRDRLLVRVLNRGGVEESLLSVGGARSAC